MGRVRRVSGLAETTGEKNVGSHLKSRTGVLQKMEQRQVGQRTDEEF